MNKFQIPYTFKKIGWIVFIVSFISIFVIAINVTDNDLKKPLLIATQYGILLSLLLISLSREPIEDEFIKSTRLQSYMIAFIAGVAQALVSPFIHIGVDTLLTEESSFQPAGNFYILWILLLCQIICFNVLKWRAND